ncbi:MAG TPA: type I polyketide synthase, partial [Micromonosporaceae bacterium]|nr:type I polyketide synthase [Micromonosporaceae bacterium]
MGSIKSNLGHTQAAAGVAGVIKMVLAMHHRQAPRTLHVDAPSSQVDWSAGAVELLAQAQPWPDTGRPRRAAVSSFGISGTNAHVILEQPPTPVPEPEASVQLPVLPVLPLVLSAASRDALAAQAARLLTFVTERPASAIADTCFSLATTRAALPHRAVVVGADRDALVRGLIAVTKGKPARSVLTGTANAGRTGFVFAGQGAQRAGMGTRLAEAFPVFAEALDEVHTLLDPLLGTDLRAVVGSGDGLQDTGFAQPALFAFEVALLRLLRSWGIRPAVVAGHSVGEIAAVHAAGVLSLPDAARLVAARGRLIQALPGGGAMIAVRAAERDVRPLLVDGVELAAVNGPESVVLSGEDGAVTALAAELAGRGHQTSRLRVSHAFHSALMEPMLDDLRAALSGLEFAEPSVPVVSTLTGRPVEPGQLATAEYWVRQAREAVRFADAVTAMRTLGVTRFVELGPDATLTAMAADSLDGDHRAALIAMQRKAGTVADNLGDAIAALGALHAHGARVDWPAVFGPGARRVDLPTYQFQHERYWLTATGDRDVASAGLNPAEHPLLSAAVAMPDAGGVLLTGRLSTAGHPWLADHRVFGHVLLPGTAFVELALRAGAEVGCTELAELTVEAPLVLPDSGGVAVQVAVGAPDEAGRRAVTVHSVPDGAGAAWTRHASGRLAAPVPGTERGDRALAEWPPPGAEQLDVDGLYPGLAEAGLRYGPAFRGVRAAWRLGDTVYAEVAVPPTEQAAAGRFGVHPALLDAALHAAGAGGGPDAEASVPFAWSGVRLHARGADAVRVRLRRTGGEHRTAGGAGEYGTAGAGDQDRLALLLADAAGRPVLSVADLALRRITAEQLAVRAADARQDSLFRLDW